MTVQLEDVPHAQRAHWVGVLAKADGAALRSLMDGLAAQPDYAVLRGPEVGLVMVQGRAGGTGMAFNLGEMTVTRCSVRAADGTVGHAVVRGRDPRHAEAAAWLDALLQVPTRREALLSAVIVPLAQEAAARRDLAARKAAATRVDFFTMATEQP
jgi:alpha-D-ribose 1-methylphosphonate 5-triphosphate synthase subunit PhnG